MTQLANVHTLTRRETGYEAPVIDPDRVEAIISSVCAAFLIPCPTLPVRNALTTCTTSRRKADLASSSSIYWCVPSNGSSRTAEIRGKAAPSTSTTINTVGRLLRAGRRDELLKRLDPARRAAFERIKQLRADGGALPFNIVRELRELRSHG